MSKRVFTPNNGLMEPIRLVDVGTAPIDVAQLETLVADPRAGAVVSFNGTVRNHDGGRDVVSLVYESHPTARQVLEDVARDIVAKYDVVAIAVAHRVGEIPIGESALVATVATGHRAHAFEACRELVELVKERIPVWKHQTFADGSDEWVNCA